jgi:uncharacterized membrane protein
MVGRIIRVVFGFLVASFVAGLVLVLFVNTPAEMPDWTSERYAETGLWALAVGTQVAVFASTFAFIGAVYAEWRGIASATYSIILGLLIAMIAFASHYAGEGSGGDVSTYALSAFVVTGIVGGYVYWYVSGRYAAPAQPEMPVAPASGAKA